MLIHHAKGLLKLMALSLTRASQKFVAKEIQYDFH